MSQRVHEMKKKKKNHPISSSSSHDRLDCTILASFFSIPKPHLKNPNSPPPTSKPHQTLDPSLLLPWQKLRTGPRNPNEEDGLHLQSPPPSNHPLLLR